MIYRLFRKELTTRTPQLISQTRTQSSYIEEISRYLKLIKKKELLYIKILQSSNFNKNTPSQQLEQYVKEYESLLTENKKIEVAFREFQHQDFYHSKTYLYTMFLRIRDIFETQGKRFKVEGKNTIEKMFEDGKVQIEEIYANQNYLEKYQMLELMEYVNKHQNRRISLLLPRKTPSLTPLERPSKLLEKLRNTDAGKSMLRKTISVELVKNKQSQLEALVNKKLIIHQLATEKRLQQRKIKQKAVNLFKLYSKAMQIKEFPDRSQANKEALQENMLERNKQLKEGIKKFEKQYLLFKFCRKDKK